MKGLLALALMLLFAIAALEARIATTVLTDNDHETVFSVAIDKLDILYIGDGLTVISHPEFGPRGDENAPMLIGYSFDVAVPKNCDLEVFMQNIVWSEWQDIVPASMCSLTFYHNAPGERDANSYSEISGGTAKLDADMIWRDVRVAAIDYMPAQYDPNLGVRFAKYAEIVVQHENGTNRECSQRYYHPIFADLYRALLINAEAAIPDFEPRARAVWDPDSGAELLVIVHSSFQTDLQPWVDWKLFMGMPTRVVTTDVAGIDTLSIKTYIQNAYDTWTIPPAAVLLVSDANYIAAFQISGGCNGDNDYGTVVGTDIVPDILIGRISIDNTTQMQTTRNKHLNYEKQPDTTDHWYARYVGIVNEEDCPYSPTGGTDSSYLEAVTYGRDQVIAAGFDSYPMLRDCNGETWSNAAPYYQAGLGLVQYRGQAWPDYYAPFNNGLDTMQNNGKCPVNISITCGTGGFFSGDDRMCERSTRAGTPTAPKGSVAFTGQSLVSSNSIHRSALSKKIYMGLFAARLNALAAAQQYGKTELMNQYGWSNSSAKYEYYSNTLLGSPEMLVWTAHIMPATVTHPTVLTEGPTTFAVTVRRGTSTLQGARVAVHQLGNFTYGTTNASGVANLNISPVAGEPLIVVVTGPNIYPYVDTLEVTAAGVAIYPVATTYIERWGDGDGRINPGERIKFRPRFTNLGTLTGTGLSAKARSNDPGIIFLDSTTIIPAIAPGETLYGDTIAFEVSSTHAASEGIELLYYITSSSDGPWTRTQVSPPKVHRFRATLSSFTITDTAPYGDGDGTLEVGEQAFLSVNLANETQASCLSLGATATLSTTASLAVSPDACDFGSFSPGVTRTSTPAYILYVSPDAVPGEEIEVRINTVDRCFSYFARDTLTFNVQIAGVTTSLPTGPDAYGYYIYDNTDTLSGRAPTFSWTSIATLGTTIAAITNADDASATVSLPFTFTFYGNNYTSINVTSNGIVTPPTVTHSGSGSGTPQHFPTTGRPQGVVSPMWADLAPHRAGGGEIYQYYDSANHQFVVQWDTCGFYYGGGAVTVQMRICDPAYYSTPTGDSEILFLYNYILTAWNLGVGIEKPDETTGLEYFLNGTYDIHAAEIAAGRALKITTSAPIVTTRPWIFYLDSLSFDDGVSDGDGIIEAGDQISLRLRVKNGGTASAANTSIQPIATTYVTEAGSAVLFGNIAAGSARRSASALRFRISPSFSGTNLTVPLRVTANSGAYIDTIIVNIPVGKRVDIGEDKILPRGISALKISPNPFNAATSIEFAVGADMANERITVNVFDLDGRNITNLCDDVLGSGMHAFKFAGENVPSGVYFVKISARNFNESRQLLLVK